MKIPGENVQKLGPEVSLKLWRVIWVGGIDLEVIVHVLWEVNVIVVNDAS